MDVQVATLRRIVLELAREPGSPGGDREVRYTLIAPLDHEGRLNAEAWRREKDRVRVIREAPNEETAVGHLEQGPGECWVLTYDLEGERGDETGFRFAEERFVPGEYVSIQSDGETHVYKVIIALPV